MSASVEPCPAFDGPTNCVRGGQRHPIATHIKPAALCGAPPGGSHFRAEEYQRQARGALRHDAVEAVLDCDDDGRHGKLRGLVPGDGIELQAHIIQRRHGADEQTHGQEVPVGVERPADIQRRHQRRN